MRNNPLTIDVYTKAFQWQGGIGDPVSADGTVRHHGTGNVQLRLRSGDPMIEDVLRKGARVTIQYRGGPLFSGKFRTKTGDLLPNGDLVIQAQSDWRLMQNTLALVAPGAPIAPLDLNGYSSGGAAQAQYYGWPNFDPVWEGTLEGQYGYYLWPDGSGQAGGILVSKAESAIKEIIRQNFVRLGRPVTIAPDLLRGGDARAAGVLPDIRMARLDEAVASLLEWSGLTLNLMQQRRASTIELDVAPRGVWEAPLTVGSGIVDGGTWALNDPTATRILVGGPGEGAARAFWSVKNTALEDEYGDIIEVFRDATGAQLEWNDGTGDAYKVAKYFLLSPNASAGDKAAFSSYLTRAGEDALAEGAPTSSVQATLSESETFYFGGLEGVQLGDRVTIKSSDEVGAETFTDTVTEATFSLTSDDFYVQPVLGQKVDDPMRSLAEAVARVAGSQRRLSTNR